MLKGIMSGNKETGNEMTHTAGEACGDLSLGSWDEGAKKCKDSGYILEGELVDEINIGCKI